MQEFYKAIQCGGVTHIGYKEGNQCIMNELIDIEISDDDNIIFRYNVTDKNIILNKEERVLCFFVGDIVYQLIIKKKITKTLYLNSEEYVQILGN